MDSTGTPATARVIIGEIRKVTPQPVRYLVNSHWHWDHWGGNQAYREAYPGIEIVSQEKTKEQMRTVSVPRATKDLKDLAEYLDQFEQELGKRKAKGDAGEKIAANEALLAADRDFLAQKRAVEYTYPNVTFSEAMTVSLGGRDVQVLHAKAITPGDSFLFLPKERILVTGDVAIEPYPFAIGGTYPAEWVKTLERMIAMDPVWVVPGHGAAQNGTALLEKTLLMMQAVMNDVKEAKGKGATEQQAVEAEGVKAAEIAGKVGIREAGAVEQFKDYFLNVFTKRAWEELEHPLAEDTPGS